jgi:hypothetical protein
MSARLFWAIVVAATALVIFGLLFFNPPQPENVEIRSIEEYYRVQSILAAVAGILVGVVMGWLARGNVYHEPRDRGDDYNQRVIGRGLLTGAVSVILVSVISAAMAVWWTLEPLAPLEKVTLVMGSGMFLVVLLIGGAAALVVYALMTRSTAWSGQYTLIKRF